VVAGPKILNWSGPAPVRSDLTDYHSEISESV